MRTLFIVFLFIGYNSFGQNLVPNSSFEEQDTCPYSPSNFSMVNNWDRVSGYCVYYDECGTNGCGVPINWGGLCKFWSSIFRNYCAFV